MHDDDTKHRTEVVSLHTCAICATSFERLTSLIRHASRMHGISRRDYVVRYELMGVVPTCACGCGSAVTWHRGSFRRFVRGHANRDIMIRASMVEGGRAAAADPVCRQKNSDALTVKWSDPTWRAVMLAKLEETSETRVANARHKNQSPEFADHMSRLKQALWDDPEWASAQRTMMSSAEYAAAVSGPTREALSDPDRRARLSSHMRDQYASGHRKPKTNWSNINGSWAMNGLTGIDEWYDSGWELEFAETCWEHGLPTERNGLVVPYDDGFGISHSYHVDFVLPSVSMAIEIKGQRADVDRLKEHAAVELCKRIGLTYTVLHKRDFRTFFAGFKT